MGWGWGYRPYVSVAKRKAQAEKQVQKMKKKGKAVSPVRIEGKTIAKSFWGKGWCDHMESFHDYENRLPRGRAYVRNGSVVHLEIAGGEVMAYVAGSSLYTVKIGVKPLPKARWEEIRKNCAGQIASLVDLLQGRLSDGVMRQVACRDGGLFPHPKELTLNCSCPDWATMCKHVAAVCYGVGARLDETPELLFRLRGVDHEELVAAAGVASVLDMGAAAAGRKRVEGDLSEVFGIDLADAGEALVVATGATVVQDDTQTNTTSTEPRRRGRPRKAVALRIIPPTKPEKPAPPEKKPRGRPRKAATAVANPTPPAEKTAMKKKRGRKPVQRVASPTHAKGAAAAKTATRPRGRPRKTAVSNLEKVRAKLLRALRRAAAARKKKMLAEKKARAKPSRRAKKTESPPARTAKPAKRPAKR